MKRKFGIHDVVGLFSKLYDILRYAFLAIGAIAMFAWMIPYFRNLLETKKLFDEKTVPGVAALALVFLLGALLSVGKNLKELPNEIKELLGIGSTIIKGGVGQVYPHLQDALGCQKTWRKQSLDVLGLTLQTTWHHICPWINQGVIRNTKIRLFCLDPAYLRKHPESISAEWADVAQTQIDSIRRYMVEGAREMHARSVTIELFLNHNFPAMHGFRLGSGELFISFSQWTGEPGARHLDYARQFYERFRANDRSERAEEYRSLFENWIDEGLTRSVQSVPPSSKGSAEPINIRSTSH